MWLATKMGFYSITKKDDDEYHVRARERVDLENLVEAIGGPEWVTAPPDARPAPSGGIFESGPKADYRWRVVVDSTGYQVIMRVLTDAVDYANFKSEVHKQPTQVNKDRIYAAWWHDMFRLQNNLADEDEWEEEFSHEDYSEGHITPSLFKGPGLVSAGDILGDDFPGISAKPTPYDAGEPADEEEGESRG